MSKLTLTMPVAFPSLFTMYLMVSASTIFLTVVELEEERTASRVLETSSIEKVAPAGYRLVIVTEWRAGGAMGASGSSGGVGGESPAASVESSVVEKEEWRGRFDDVGKAARRGLRRRLDWITGMVRGVARCRALAADC